MLNQLKHFVQSIFFMYNWDYYVLVIFLLVVSVIYIVLKNLITNNKLTNSIIIISFVIYFCLMIYTALIDRTVTEGEANYCLIPFYSYYQYFNGNKDIMQQSIMNIAFFYPFGFLLSCLDIELIKKRKWLIVIFAMLFSLCVEIMQYIFRLGYAEIDDVIHNTLGAFIGVAMSVIFDKLFDFAKSKMKKN